MDTLDAMSRGRRRLLFSALVGGMVVTALAVATQCGQVSRPRGVADVGPGTAPKGSAQFRTDKTKPLAPIGGLRLEGQVVDDQERPVSAARVMLDEYDTETTSNDDGSFVFERLGASEY